MALLVSVFAALPSLALTYKKIYGIWTARISETELDTIRLKKKHFFERNIIKYERVQIPKRDGSELTTLSESQRTVDKGLWYIVEDQIRVRFNRTVDGVPQPHTVNGEEGAHTLFIEVRDGQLVIVDLDGEALPPEEQRAFSRPSDAEGE
jgi:hypothetical protein